MKDKIVNMYKDLPLSQLLNMKEYFENANKFLDCETEEAYKNAMNCNSIIISAIEEVINDRK